MTVRRNIIYKYLNKTINLRLPIIATRNNRTFAYTYIYTKPSISNKKLLLRKILLQPEFEKLIYYKYKNHVKDR